MLRLRGSIMLATCRRALRLGCPLGAVRANSGSRSAAVIGGGGGGGAGSAILALRARHQRIICYSPILALSASRRRSAGSLCRHITGTRNPQQVLRVRRHASQILGLPIKRRNALADG